MDNLTRICGDLSGIDIDTITPDMVRAMAQQWRDLGEPCSEQEYEAAIDDLREMQVSGGGAS